MIAVDGRVLMYDLIGGGILSIRAEPEFILKMKEDEDRVYLRWGLRADFPDAESGITINFDPAGLLFRLSKGKQEAIFQDGSLGVVEFRDQHLRATLTTEKNTPSRFSSFTLDISPTGQRVIVRADSFLVDGRLPSWHRSLDQHWLAKGMAVRAVSDAKNMSSEVQARMTAFQQLLSQGGIFHLTLALRNEEVRLAMEKNSRIDFGEVRANHERIKDAWLKSLREQEFELPKVKRATSTQTVELP
ncbi:MAG: hypothetical protein AAB263_19165 [Planctomycetota bacterium]